MAETKTSISELSAATSVGSNDLLFISQLSGSTWNSKKATVGQLPFGQGTITGITMNGASKGTSGNVDLGTVLTSVPTSYKTYSDTKTALDSVYKPLQDAKTDPTASGNTTSFIDTITQNANGVITATKKTVQAASTSAAGIVQLNDTLSSTSTTQAATANAVKTAYDGCLKNNVVEQTLSANVFTQKSSISQDTSEETFIHRINFTDSTNRRIGDISTRKTAAGNYLTGFACRAPVGTDGAEVVSYVNAIVGSDGTSYITIPTPDLSSNSNIAATTEWVNNALNTRIPRSVVSATTLQLKNQTCNTISISTAGTYVFIPPEKISGVSRHYYLYLMNNTTSDITVKFSRTNPGESTATVAYYSDATFTPTTTLAGKSGYVYEFLEFSPDAIKVTQEQMYRRTSLEV